MKIRNKYFGFIMFFSSIILIQSCIETSEYEPRTAETEKEELELFLSQLMENGYDIDTTSSGVFYVVDTLGAGPFPVEGDSVWVGYTGTFLNGSIFDTSIDHWPGGIWDFVYLEQNLIQGFNDALAIMNKGAKIDAIIPSALGYGVTGYGTIPPYTPLIFSLKLYDIKSNTED